MARTFYDVLMIKPQADRQLITVVYRHLAKRYHPDRDASPQAAARMAELNEAYATLSDVVKRARYDEHIGLVRSRARPAVRGEASRAQQGSANLPPTPAAPHGEAGPPPPNPAPNGSALTFGRYRGWTLNQVARYDFDYVEWLSRTTMGRNYKRELDGLLRRAP